MTAALKSLFAGLRSAQWGKFHRLRERRDEKPPCSACPPGRHGRCKPRDTRAKIRIGAAPALRAIYRSVGINGAFQIGSETSCATGFAVRIVSGNSKASPPSETPPRRRNAAVDVVAVATERGW